MRNLLQVRGLLQITYLNGDARLASDTGCELGTPELTHQLFPTTLRVLSYFDGQAVDVLNQWFPNCGPRPAPVCGACASPRRTGHLSASGTNVFTNCSKNSAEYSSICNTSENFS